MSTTPSATELAAWVGRSETVHDTITAAPVQALAATLDQPAVAVASGMPLPPLWHWLYFLPLHRHSEIGTDGHARRGGFMPPVPLPRRMWAGSQFEFRTPVRVGDQVARTSTIADVTQKDGRTGKLVFVKVRHELRCNGASAPALVEFHDIVYRDAQRAGDMAPPPQRPPVPDQRPQQAWERVIVADAVLLFRYSALTFNGHRIHYDRQYATEVEGYPGLIVHGPLIATLLMDLLRRNLPDAAVASFHFKAVRPTFDLHPFKLSGRLLERPASAAMAGAGQGGNTVQLWAQDHEGWLTMDATATLKSG